MTRRGAAFVAALVAGPPALLLALALAVRAHFAFDLPPPLPDDAVAAAMSTLRAVVDGRPPSRPAHPALDRRLRHGGPVIVSLWVDGRRVVRLEGRGGTVAEALEAAARQLADAPRLGALDAAARRRARLQLDVLVARAPLATSVGLARAFGVLPGMDGVGVEVATKELFLAADELVEMRLLLAERLMPFMEFDVGLDFRGVEAEMARRAALPPGEFTRSERRWFRFRAESFVERPEAARGAGPPLRLVRGLPAGPPLTKEALLQGARDGGRYLVAHLAENGRYVYELNLTSGRGSDPFHLGGAYSLPRHAGTTYYLAELYEVTRDPAVRGAIERAIDHMVELVRAGGCAGTTADGRAWACVVDKGAAKAVMGSTALAVVTLAKYRQVTGDTRYDDLHRALVEWVLDLQLPSGRFVHIYDVPTRQRDETTQLLYFDGEAALALLRSYKEFGDERMLRGAERALDALVGWYGEFWTGRFFFGEEHWTCIAAEAAWPDLKHDRYREFCGDYAAFLRETQFQRGETPDQPDLEGGYSVTPFFVPHNTPVGSRSEAMISAYLLTRHHGKPDERIRRQVLLSMEYLLRQQVREENGWWTPVPTAIGAMPGSSIDRIVRIDYVQHTCSAMLRSIPLLDEGR